MKSQSKQPANRAAWTLNCNCRSKEGLGAGGWCSWRGAHPSCTMWAPRSTDILLELAPCNLAVPRLKSCVLKRMTPLFCLWKWLCTQGHFWWQRKEHPKLWEHINWLSAAGVKMDFHCWQKMWEALTVACDGSLFTFFRKGCLHHLLWDYADSVS